MEGIGLGQCECAGGVIDRRLVYCCCPRTTMKKPLLSYVEWWWTCNEVVRTSHCSAIGKRFVINCWQRKHQFIVRIIKLRTLRMYLGPWLPGDDDDCRHSLSCFGVFFLVSKSIDSGRILDCCSVIILRNSIGKWWYTLLPLLGTIALLLSRQCKCIPLRSNLFFWTPLSYKPHHRSLLDYYAIRMYKK